MATGFPSAQAYTTPPNSHGVHAIHHGLQQFSPSDSATNTPIDQSPLSPNPSNFPTLPLSGRQLRPPKSPMYVPAALRPTERPHRTSPLTPPRSLHGSTDSLDRTGGESRPVSRRSTASTRKRITLNQVAEDEALININNDDNEEDDSDLPPIEGTPSRTHWKPDSKATICDAPTCHKNFNLFERRHHCRHCGHVFCNTHSQHKIPLDHNAEFHPEGAPSRGCQHCWDRYCLWRAQRSSRNNSLTSGATAMTMGTPVPGGGGVGNGLEVHRGSLANSVPRDWNWSTF
ncbi:MAG: hypothetical protein L6R38_002412 [Xanthoria sp. 2 TBL-2021]|nr:MAG: hypothetical protein L6R38_002412 [Xanthoria sp. 2 TBL-2021]